MPTVTRSANTGPISAKTVVVVNTAHINSAIFQTESGDGKAAPDCPRVIPRNFLPRESLVTQIVAVLSHCRFCVLAGPSGSGKTVLAALVARAVEARTIWVSSALWTPDTPQPSPNDLVVIDDLCLDHDVVEQAWLVNLEAQTIITTRDDDVAETISARLGYANREDAIVHVPGLSEQESVEFLQSTLGNRLTPEERIALAKRLQGFPLALQAIPELILRGHLRPPGRKKYFWEWIRSLLLDNRKRNQLARLEEVLTGDGSIDTSALASITIESLLGLGDAHSAVRAICRSSFVGMSETALAYVLETSEADIKKILAPLIRTGYIRRSCSFRAPDDQILIPHDLLRHHFSEREETVEDRNNDTRYVSFIASQITKGRARTLGFSTCIDGWIVGARDTFADRERPVFLKTLEQYSILLGGISEGLAHSRLFGERVAGLLAPRLHLAGCNELIPVGQVFSILPPSVVVARTAWIGASHPHDAWARAICMHAAILHWSRLPEDVRMLGVSLIEQWIIQSLSGDPDCMIREVVPECPYEFDLDISVAIGGLCVLGAIDRALHHLRSATFRQRFGVTVLSDAAVVVWATDHQQSQWVRTVIGELGSHIALGPTREMVEKYVAARGHGELPSTNCEYELPVSFALQVADCVSSDEFINFLETKARKLAGISFIKPRK